MTFPGKASFRIFALASLLCTSSIYAATASAPPSNKRWYRFLNDSGVPTLSDQVTEEHVRRGYEILDRNMQVLKRIPPFNEEAYLKDKAKRDAALRQQQEDARILRLYASSRDAELARNRLLDTLETSIGYNSLQLQRIKRLRVEIVEQAADIERSGKPVPAKMKEQIHQYDLQIHDLNSLIASQRSEQAKVRQDFIPIILRLGELERNPGSGLPASSTGQALTP